jgi:hypothetical protein
MKRFLPFILISALLFPAFSHAAAVLPTVKAADAGTQTAAVQPINPDPAYLNTTPLDGKPLSVQKTTLEAALTDIMTRLNALSTQTQVTINQINASGITTNDAQNSLIAANNSLAKAKIDIEKIDDQQTVDDMKYGVKVSEDDLHAARIGILASLASLQAGLPALDSANQ